MDAPRALVAKPPTGRKMKPRAPPPPGKPATVNMHSEQNPPQDASPGPQQNLLKMKENLQNSVVAITVVLPSGLEKRSVVNGSRAMMDLLVELCLQNHLNPSHHALEIRSLETQQPLSFKPNTLVGTLNVHTVFLKEKVREEKVKPGPPKAPEKSVRLVVNYLRTQKAVVRVSPEVPLRNILPVICAKCEVSPEHVVLLRDSAAGEELELSKSLNELGIKELYAWDNKRVLLTKTQSEPSLSCEETFRNSSLGNEETDKEKKKFLGFFRANKRSNSKAEQIGLSGVDSDEDTSKSALGRGSNGCVTTPNSPAVNPRSAPLGPSLSLSNISGVSVKSDMKKRRAPPPPPLPGTGTGPPAQDKPSEKVSLGSQIDLQKKKRRAPAPPPLQPPPPSPVVPARIDDKEEHRKSGAGVGRQVPQKPPRGSARGPPQLVLPPPPPYPPPDMDVAEPLSFPGQNAGPEASDLTPTLSLLLGPGSPCSEDGVPPALTEAEETVSVGSCFASEDTTEDSGVMSSPSDIISLDSQHDSMKSKDKWATDQEDCSDQDLAGTPELGPQKSPSWERSSSGTWHPRSEKAAISSNGEDLFITGQFQKTLAELNEDLEEMEESYETDTSSPTSSVNGMSSGCTRDTVVPHSDVDTIPVTFIGEVLDDPVDLVLFSNRNNNAGSFDMGNIASRRVDLPPDHAEHSQEHSKKRTGLPTSAAVSHGVGKQLKFSVSQTCKDVNLNQGEPKMTSAPKLHTHDLSAKEKGREPTSTLRGKTQAVRTSTPPPVEEKEGGGGKNGVSAPPSWYQRAQNSGGSYGLKYGLTTYKIVPPKSEMRCYDRGVSLSVGAIKIDELGNLVCPRTHAGRTTALPSSTLEAEMQPIGKVKDFWRSNSMGKQCGRPMECSAKRSPTPAAPVELQHPESRPKAEPAFPDPRVALPQQLATHHGDGSHAQEGRSRPPTATPGQLRGPAATTEVPFLKPQRRTSSQYVASAIAKRIGTPRAHPDVVRKQDDVQEPHEGRGPEPAGRPPTAKDAATPSRCSESHDREDSGESAVGAHPRQQVSSPHGELCTQHCSAGIHRGSSVPLVPASQRDHVSVGRSCDSSGQQSTSSHRTRSASDPKSTLDSTNPLRPHSDDQTHVRALVNDSRWVPTHGEPPPSSRAAGTCSHAGWEPSEREKPSLSCTEVHTSNGVLPPSIFGPKKKFRPVVQRPAPRDTCLHSALMEAIHSAGGRDRLRKTTEHTAEGGPKKPSYVEAESERSALLAAIRRHSGACSLRKVSSSASKELQSARDTALSAPRSKPAGLEDLPAQPSASLPAPPPPAPRAPSAARTASRASSGPVSNPAEARQALMDAIRSGTGAARLRKVPLLV